MSDEAKKPDYLNNLNDAEAAFLDNVRKESKDAAIGGCSICEGMGILTADRKPHPQPGEPVVICNCEKNRMRYRQYQAACLPQPFFNSVMEDWNVRQDVYGNTMTENQQRTKRQVKALMQRYLKVIPALCAGKKLELKHPSGYRERFNSIVFIGGKNSGKTLLASIMIKEAIEKGLSAKFYEWANLSQTISIFEQWREQNDIAQELSELDFVVIDGVYNNYHSGQCYKAQLERLARVRQRSGKPTVITCYETFEEIPGDIGWKSFLDDCFHMTLPTTEKPRLR